MTRKKTVLLVDDEPTNLSVINEGLRREFHTRIATDGRRALALACGETRPDLILLDVSMPGMDGYEVCARLKGDRGTADIPVIFLSSLDQADEITRGLELGAVDYVSKPVVLSILLARVRNHLRLRDANEMLADRNRSLDRLVGERTRALRDKTNEMLRVQDLTIVALGTLAETRDNETGNHIVRTQAYVRALVEELSGSSFQKRNPTAYEWTQIWKAAPLHDIGKVGIPDRILLKPGRLTGDEFAVMKQHTRLGREALYTAEARANVTKSRLQAACEIAYSHHERWNGSGYPEGIGGAAIPVSARLMAVADVYDALISPRVYKAPIEHGTATDIIRSERGRQFDPDVVDCMLDLAAEFQGIAGRFADAAAMPVAAGAAVLPAPPGWLRMEGGGT